MKRAALATNQVDAQDHRSACFLFFSLVTLPNYQLNINRKGTGSTLSLFGDKSSGRQT